VMVVQSRPMFVLPFTSLDDVLATNPLSLHRQSHEKREKRDKREKHRSHTPMDPMPRIA